MKVQGSRKKILPGESASTSESESDSSDSSSSSSSAESKDSESESNDSSNGQFKPSIGHESSDSVQMSWFSPFH